MRTLSRRHALGLLSLGAGVSLASGSFAQDTKKVAFILNGTPGDVGWNFEHERGIQEAKSVFGNSVIIDTFYGVKEWGEEDASKMLELIVDGYDMIFACSFGYGQSLVQMALATPSVTFEHCGGYVLANNVSTYSARWYEGRMPQGLIAGSVTKTNRIGYLASFPIPQVVRGINAAFLAARSVNPDVQFDVVWLNSWFSPEKEEATSRLLISGGADVLLAHTNTTKPTEVAEELGAYAFGQASDMTKYGPNATLSSTINSWGPYYVKRIAAFLNKEWRSTDTWGGYAEGMIASGSLSNRIPVLARAKVADAINGLRKRDVSAFEGPVLRQDGSVFLADGQIATDSELLRMNFYLDGMSGKMPSPST